MAASRRISGWSIFLEENLSMSASNNQKQHDKELIEIEKKWRNLTRKEQDKWRRRAELEDYRSHDTDNTSKTQELLDEKFDVYEMELEEYIKYNVHCNT